MIVKDLQPFSIVKDAGVQGLITHIVPQYHFKYALTPLFLFCG